MSTLEEKLKREAREKAKPFYFDQGRTVERMCVTVEDLDQIITSTIEEVRREERKHVLNDLQGKHSGDIRQETILRSLEEVAKYRLEEINTHQLGCGQCDTTAQELLSHTQPPTEPENDTYIEASIGGKRVVLKDTNSLDSTLSDKEAYQIENEWAEFDEEFTGNPSGYWNDDDVGPNDIKAFITANFIPRTTLKEGLENVVKEVIEKMKMEGEMAKLTPFQQTVNTYIENRGKEILADLEGIKRKFNL